MAPLDPYIPPFKPVPQVTPFTYRDGVTMLKKVDGIVKYINKVIIPFINTQNAALAQAFEDEVNRLILEVNTALENQTEYVDNAIFNLTAYVDEQVSLIINDSIEVQDPLVATLINDEDSDTRIALDDHYQPVDTVSDSAVQELVADDESATRVALDTLYQDAGSVNDAAVSATIEDADSETRTSLDELYQGAGTASDSAVAALIADEDSATNDALVYVNSHSRLEDGVSEWWCHPVATTLSDPYERTVFGTISADGVVQACEFNHATRVTTKTPMGTVTVDDHNAPAIWVAPGRRIVAAWTDHNRDNIIRLRVGGKTGDIESLKNATTINIDLGGGASYTQIHKIKHLSSDIVDAFWIITRKGNDAWGYVEVYVNQSNGSVLYNPYAPIVRAPGRQCYVTSADANRPDGYNQVLRIAWGYNPAQAVHSVYYMEIDVVSGKIGSPVQPSWTATAGIEITDSGTALAPLIPDVASGNSRRLFYVRPGPDSPAVAYADWNLSTPDNATYNVREFSSGGDLVSAGGYAETPSTNFAAFGRGFEIESVFKMPSPLNGTMGIAGMPVAGARVFFLRLTQAGDIEFAVYDNTDTAVAYHTTTAPLASYMVPGAVIGVRVRIDLDNRILERYVSTDAGASWVRVSTTALGSESDTIVANGIRTGTRSPLRIAFGSAGGEAGKINVRSFSLKNRVRSAEIAGARFDRGDWLGGVDTHGNVFTMNGSAAVDSPTWATNSFGIAGPRVGYSEAANYVAGMAFENPSTMRRVITAHSAAGREIIRLWEFESGVYENREVLNEPTSDSRRIRPVAPVNGKVTRIGHTRITQYGETFLDYEGDWEIVNS